MFIKDFKFDLVSAKSLFISFGLMTIILLISNLVFADDTAASGGAIGDTLCNIVAAIQGRIGKGIATIGIVALGIGLFAGKLNWPLAIATAIGIGLIFGAASIMDFISTDAAGSTTGCPAATTH